MIKPSAFIGKLTVANKIIMIGNAFDAIQNSAEGGKTDFSEEEEE